MSDLIRSLSVSASGMEAQARRLRHASENIANTDTPGYRRKTIEFRALADGRVAIGQLRLDRTDLQRVHDPSHPMADASGHYLGSNVDMVIEIADAREAQRSYDANLRMFDHVRQMTQGLIELLRR